VAEDSDSSSTQVGHRVPPLPRELAEPTPVVLAGTLLWVIGVAVFGALGWFGGGVGVQFWTCLVGAALGMVGFGVFRWQRSASRRGSRGAWKGLAGLDG
jgi:hypothetical protein